MGISDLFSLLGKYPMLLIAVILSLAVLFVCGWTDCPNLVSTCVSTRCMKPRNAIIMCSIFNFIGLISMFFISQKTASTIINLVDFGSNYGLALNALCAAMVGVVIWGIFATSLGIPSSQSHSLIAGIVGAGIAVIVFSPYTGAKIDLSFNSSVMLTVYGLFLSLIFGFVVGLLSTKLIILLFKNMEIKKASPLFKKAEIGSCALLSFVHGAQDGLKFLGVIFLAIELSLKSDGNFDSLNLNSLWYLTIIAALFLSLGSLVGSNKMIKRVGMNMVPLREYEGFATDFTSSIGVLISTFLGLPISTSQVKTAAILGVGASKNIKRINWKSALSMIINWLFTFPGCGLVGFLITTLFIYIF